MKEDKITYNHGKIINIYIFYEVNKNFKISNYPTLENCLFGSGSLTKNGDIDQYKYSGYEIGSFLHCGCGTGRNVIIFGVDMSSTTKIDNRKKDISI